MPRAISVDLRARVLSAYDGGMRPVEIIEQFQVKEWWFYNLLRQRKERGTIEPKPPTGGPKSKLAGHEETLRKQVAAEPDLTLDELRDKLPFPIGRSTLGRALQQLQLTFKKNPSRQRTKAT
jgi:transposase